MTLTESKALTQAQLVEKFHAHGCADVTPRRVADWRRNDVLPPFDVIGRGRGGREHGRHSSVWADGDAVLNQALWVYQLLKTHQSFLDLYLPLWLLGFSIPLNRIRDALLKPLEMVSSEVAFEIDGKNAIEDRIDDAAFEFMQGVQRANWNVLDIPPEVLAAMMNILLNSAYNMEDEPFENAVDSLGEWERNLQQRCFEFLDDAKAVSRAEQLPNESGIFRHAGFVNNFLSVPHLRQVVTECTDEDLLAVDKDVSWLREIVFEIQRLLPVVLRHVPTEMQPKRDEMLATVLSVGQLSLLVDLSLRSRGYGELIDHVLMYLLNSIQTQTPEDVEKWIAPFEVELQSAFSVMMQLVDWLANGSGGQPSVQIT